MLHNNCVKIAYGVYSFYVMIIGLDEVLYTVNLTLGAREEGKLK
jgi:hypothetical protein